jgi:hypothetical protein
LYQRQYQYQYQHQHQHHHQHCPVYFASAGDRHGTLLSILHQLPQHPAPDKAEAAAQSVHGCSYLLVLVRLGGSIALAASVVRCQRSQRSRLCRHGVLGSRRPHRVAVYWQSSRHGTAAVRPIGKKRLAPSPPLRTWDRRHVETKCVPAHWRRPAPILQQGPAVDGATRDSPVPTVFSRHHTNFCTLCSTNPPPRQPSLPIACPQHNTTQDKTRPHVCASSMSAAVLCIGIGIGIGIALHGDAMQCNQSREEPIAAVRARGQASRSQQHCPPLNPFANQQYAFRTSAAVLPVAAPSFCPACPCDV